MAARSPPILAILLAALLVWSPASSAAQTTDAPASKAGGNAAEFDAAFHRLNGPEFLDVPSAKVEAELKHLRGLLPAGDAARTTRFRSVYCTSLDWKDPRQGRSYSDETLRQATAAGDQASQARALLCRAAYTMLVDGSQQGLPDLDAAIKLLRESPEQQLLGEALQTRGDLLSLLGEQAKAMQNFQHARTAYHAAGITQEIDPLTFSMAIAYRRMGEWERARRYFTTAEQRARVAGNFEAVATNLLQLGFLGLESNAPDKAMTAFTQAADIASQHADNSSLNAARMGIAEAQILLDHPDRALAALQQAEAGFRADQDTASHDMLLLLTGRALAGKGEHQQALERFRQALPLIQASGNARYLALLHQAKAASEEALGQSAAALQDFKRFHELQVKLQDRMRLEQSQLMDFEDALRRRDHDNRLLRAEAATLQQEVEALERVRQWQRLTIALTLLLVALLFSMAWRQWRRSKQLQDLTLLDPLTGVANRPGIEQETVRALAAALRNGTPLSLLMLDLDRFKSINDRHGHAAGDQVLREVSQAWQAQLRDHDPLGRVGGEEFVVVCLDASLEKALLVAERLRETTLKLRFDAIDPALRVSVSIGAAQAYSTGDSCDALLKRADIALYRAKHAGGDRVEH